MSPFLLRRLSDEQLGGRLASGEAAAFDELYRRYVHRLAAYGAHVLGDAATGDDVAQATLLKAYATLRDGRAPRRLRPWLYRVAHNVAIDLVRRRRELPAAELPEPPAGGEFASSELVAALAALPERQRHVYVLRELHGLRIDETAAELQLTVPQVEQALFAARNRLAEHLVFGERIDCVAVRRLASGPLAFDERRALKTHLRSCPACRSSLGLRGRALGSLPVAPFDWLRGLTGLLTGTGAPVAAKVGALVAGATVAAGVPLAVERGDRPHFHAALVPLRAVHPDPPLPARVAPPPGSSEPAAVRATTPSLAAFVRPRSPAPAPAPPPPPPPAVAAAPAPRPAAKPERSSGESTGGGDAPAPPEPTRTAPTDGATSSDAPASAPSREGAQPLTSTGGQSTPDAAPTDSAPTDSAPTDSAPTDSGSGSGGDGGGDGGSGG